MNKAKNVSKRAKVIFLILFELYTVSIGVVEYMLRVERSYVPEKTNDYTALLTGFIILSVFYLALAWFMQPLLQFLASRTKRENRILGSGFWMLVLTYLCIICPTVLGQILLSLGLPFSQFIYFLVATIVIALAWGIYDLRKRPVEGLVQ